MKHFMFGLTIVVLLAMLAGSVLAADKLEKFTVNHIRQINLALYDGAILGSLRTYLDLGIIGECLVSAGQIKATIATHPEWDELPLSSAVLKASISIGCELNYSAVQKLIETYPQPGVTK